jgi:hypothetical protein
MSEFEKTDEMIPISWLLSILDNDDVFRNFITSFMSTKKDHELENYLEALNHYMQFNMEMNSSLPKKYFDKMNYINTYYHTNVEQYSYEEYQKQIESRIPLTLLEEILTDEKTNEKFLDFEEHRDTFPDYPLDTYLRALQKYVDCYRENKINLSNMIFYNFEKIKNAYIFSFPHDESLEGEGTLKKIDAQLEKTILKRVNPNASPFTLARGIYIELCKLTSYDENYDAQKRINQDSPIASEIYNKSPEEVTLDRNKLVCKTFAEIYATLLNKVGIKAIVEGDIHQYVRFECQGVLIKADATTTGFQPSDSIPLADIIRVKLNLPTIGFEAENPVNDLSYAIKEADLKNDQYRWDKTESFEKKYRQIKKLEVEDKKSFDGVITFLSEVETDKLRGLEYTEYLKMLLTSKLDKDVLSNICFSTGYQKQKDNYYSIFIIDGSEYSHDDAYYIFDPYLQVQKVDIKELIEREKTEDIIIVSNTFKRNLEVKKLGITK